MYKTKTILKISFTLAALLTFSSNSYASIVVTSDLSQEYEVNEGGSAKGTIQLKNTGTDTQEVKIYQEDVKINSNGSIDYVANKGVSNRSNAKWINLSNDHITLAPGASQQVPYSISVPNSVNGSYWSMVMVEPINQNSREAQNSQETSDSDKTILKINQKMRYAIRVLTNVGKGTTNLTIESPKVSKDENGQRVLTLAVKNTGTVFSRPKVILEVFNKDGASLGKFSAETHSLYAGARNQFNIPLNQVKPGNYKALLSAEDDKTGQVFGSDMNLTIQP